MLPDDKVEELFDLLEADEKKAITAFQLTYDKLRAQGNSSTVINRILQSTVSQSI